jgi:hypothetical protein
MRGLQASTCTCAVCACVCVCCRRLCPANKQGKRTFAPVMLDRLQRLGISKTDPAELTPEEVRGKAEAARGSWVLGRCRGGT